MHFSMCFGFSHAPSPLHHFRLPVFHASVLGIQVNAEREAELVALSARLENHAELWESMPEVAAPEAGVLEEPAATEPGPPISAGTSSSGEQGAAFDIRSKDSLIVSSFISIHITHLRMHTLAYCLLFVSRHAVMM